MCPRFAIRKGVKVLSRLDIMTPSRAQTVIDGLYRDVERRIAASPPGLCPVDLAMNFLNLCHAQTCGKCVPCRVGLGQLSDLMESVLDGKATMETIALIERTARVIVNSADCAIGRDAARLVLDGIQGFRDDYEEHVLRHRCLGGMQNPVPCVALCPAGVDIPGYTVLVKYGRYADAVRLIRQDNPFPSACAYICEHPCEARCRRNMIDDAVNIRGLKRYAVDHADDVLLRTEPFTLCEGRTATLELYGYQNGEYDCGVSRIHLLWDDGREEDLLISDLGDEVWGADGYTSCWSPENCLATGDYNFDGYRDIGLQLDNPAYNVPFYYWFYDAQTDGFRPYGSWAFAPVLHRAWPRHAAA